MPVTGPARLDDGLAGTEVPARPWTVQALRIGSVRDGSKVGVLAYSQEHAYVRHCSRPTTTQEKAPVAVGAAPGRRIRDELIRDASPGFYHAAVRRTGREGCPRGIEGAPP
jgi:hypothetical protein